jgi:hypothetical protein
MGYAQQSGALKIDETEPEWTPDFPLVWNGQ